MSPPNTSIPFAGHKSWAVKKEIIKNKNDKQIYFLFTFFSPV